MYTVEDLQAFEHEIAEFYAHGFIKAPVHLRGSDNQYYEHMLIDIFYDVEPDDYVFGYWDSHALALLKGIPRELVKQEILDGRSIALNFPAWKFYCSGIVGSLMGVAVGTAWQIKQEKASHHVWHFCGDMSASLGLFHEVTKYAAGWELPITFIVCDNGKSVLTDTRTVWGNEYVVPTSLLRNPTKVAETYKDYLINRFSYKNKWPHSGLNERVKF